MTTSHPTSVAEAAAIHNFDLSAITVNNANLIDYNTMHLACESDKLITLKCESEVEAAVVKSAEFGLPLFILSGGSNVILPNKLNACVLHPAYKGLEVIHEDENNVIIEVMGGENWHQLVLDTVNKGWYGLENLALIPGLVGASPVQNIGAYGVQLEDCMTHLKAFHLATQTWHNFEKSECQFGYRDSKFKQEPGQWLITRVGFKLHKDSRKINVKYGDVSTLALAKAQANQRSVATPIDVMKAVIEIRQSKLPDPKQLPNCGSFFKNPIIDNSHFHQLQLKYPDIVGYPVDKEFTKVAAGWLIDKVGLKGEGIFPIKTHAKQALVLVNLSGINGAQSNIEHSAENKLLNKVENIRPPATQTDIIATQTFIQQKIEQTFGILLEREPVWVNSHASYNS